LNLSLCSGLAFLDVIEAVFSAMKKAVIHGSDYQSKEEMKTAISAIFKIGTTFSSITPSAQATRLGN